MDVTFGEDNMGKLMKRMRVLLIVIFIQQIGLVEAQTIKFTWTDTIFKIGQVNHDYNVMFKFAGYEFLPESFAHLDSIYSFLTKNSNLKLEIRGNYDCRWNRRMSVRLDMARATAIKEYLIKKGIFTERLKAIGCADFHPLKLEEDLVLSADGKSKIFTKGKILTCEYIKKSGLKEYQEQLHHLNRRFDFVIVGL